MLIRTTRFGTLTVNSDDVIRFPTGILGFEDCQSWVLLADSDNDSLCWLQSTQRLETALPVVSPRRFVPDYRFRIYRSELESISAASLDDLQVLTILSRSENGLTLNLKAPILVHLKNRTARQVVVNDDHSLQFVLPTTTSRAKKIA